MRLRLHDTTTALPSEDWISRRYAIPFTSLTVGSTLKSCMWLDLNAPPIDVYSMASLTDMYLPIWRAPNLTIMAPPSSSWKNWIGVVAGS